MQSSPTSGTSWLYLAREITISKWRKSIQTGNPCDIRHAIDNDLRSPQDGLSFWLTDASTEDTALITTAIAAAPTYPDRIDIIVLSAEAVTQTGASVEQTTGRTPFTKTTARHIDVRASDDQLAQIADLILAALHEERQIRTTRSAAIALVAKALRNGDVVWEELSSSWQKAIQTATSSQPSTV